MAGLRFSTKESGARCVMMHGISEKAMLCVASLAFAALIPLIAVHDMVGELTLSGWIMVLVVEGERLHCMPAVILAGETLAVAIARMQVWFVRLSL